MAALKDTRIAFIGAGNMAHAIIGGLVNNGFNPANIQAADPYQESRSRLSAATGVATYPDNNSIIPSADVVVLAVKPQQMKAVCSGIKQAISTTNPLVVSIAAGITCSQLEKWLATENSNKIAIVRCMPNTPALVKTGATGMFANPLVSETGQNLAARILESIGIVCRVDHEAQLDAVTALSGSGPAYFFLVMEAMKEAGITLGLDAKTAEKLTLQTALGAAKMANESDVDVTELRRRVTSPGGTTEAAISSFEKNRFREIFLTALSAADARSKTLSTEME